VVEATVPGIKLSSGRIVIKMSTSPGEVAERGTCTLKRYQVRLRIKCYDIPKNIASQKEIFGLSLEVEIGVQ
jgi:hypothetical protein